MNIKKTKVVVFEPRRTPCPPFLYGEDTLKRVDSYRYLGMELLATKGMQLAVEKLVAAAWKAAFTVQRCCAELVSEIPK